MGRAFLMRMSGASCFSFPKNAVLIPLSGQRIVARLREQTYAATLRQEVEFVERGEGDALSRLSVDSSVVGERFVLVVLFRFRWLTSVKSVTQNLSDGLRAVVMSFAGRTHISSNFLGVYADQYVKKSRRNALYLFASHLPHACDRPSHISWCGRYPSRFFSSSICTHHDHNQVFYGRYIKKLSNKTQEALGDMTKVSVFLTRPTVKALIGAT